MKKIIAGLAVCLAAALFMAGCGKKADTEEEKGSAMQADYSSYVTLGEYMGIEIEAHETAISDEDVEDYAQALLYNYSNPEEVMDRNVAHGDVVNIDYRGLLDGVAFDGGTSQGFSLQIGSGSFIDGFEDGLIGAVPGEQVNLDLTFPEQYHSEELAGQAVVFEVMVNFIEGERIYPELTDEFVQENYDFDTKSAYLASLKEEMENQAEAEAEAEMKEMLVRQIISNATISEYPEDLVKEQEAELVKIYTEFAGYYGMDLPTYVNMLFGLSEEEFYSDARIVAEESVAERMVLVLISEKEGIEVSDQDLEDMALSYYFDSVQELLLTYGEDTVRESLLATKTVEYLYENAVFQ